MTDTTNLQDLKALLKWANLSDDIQELQIKYGDIELAMSRTPGGLDRPAPAPAPAARRHADELRISAGNCGPRRPI